MKSATCSNACRAVRRGEMHLLATVNRMVAGSNPARGAKPNQAIRRVVCADRRHQGAERQVERVFNPEQKIPVAGNGSSSGINDRPFSGNSAFSLGKGGYAGVGSRLPTDPIRN